MAAVGPNRFSIISIGFREAKCIFIKVLVELHILLQSEKDILNHIRTCVGVFFFYD